MKKCRCGKNLLKVLFDREIKGKYYNRDIETRKGRYKLYKRVSEQKHT